MSLRYKLRDDESTNRIKRTNQQIKIEQSEIKNAGSSYRNFNILYNIIFKIIFNNKNLSHVRN